MCRGAHAEHLDKKQPKCNGRSATFQQSNRETWPILTYHCQEVP
ncbi:hypothetical protein CES85_4789 [Ochrobactrum quorumnocens]|uniref:Uncharacterized protein n=1 Tax=Ochrobactrum quorumnocens TaxID=271865 RepID=A0A248UBC4_9HYPH|nr:hypothetical protein CES85_4789 [[Ochrobactrum] quorumnocens]